MKKIALALLLVILATTPAYADLFGGREKEQNLKAGLKAEAPSENLNAPFVDWGSIADILAALSAKMGVKEGTFFDIENEQFRNYLATTIYTMPEGVAFNVGMVGTDGVLGSVDYNIGSAISQEDVPLLSLFQYLYIGYGLGWKDQDDEDANLEEASDWQFVHGPTIVFKVAF